MSSIDARFPRLSLPLLASGGGELVVLDAVETTDQIDFLNILPTNYTVEEKAHSSRILSQAIKQHMGRALFHSDCSSLTLFRGGGKSGPGSEEVGEIHNSETLGAILRS